MRFANEALVRKFFEALPENDPTKQEYQKLRDEAKGQSTPSPHSASAKK